MELHLDLSLVDKEKEIIKHLSTYTVLIKTAGEQYSPALVANYLYDLVKLFNSFYQNVSIFGAEDQKLQSLRLLLCQGVANNIESASGLLGIDLPDSMQKKTLSERFFYLGQINCHFKRLFRTYS